MDTKAPATGAPPLVTVPLTTASARAVAAPANRMLPPGHAAIAPIPPPRRRMESSPRGRDAPAPTISAGGEADLTGRPGGSGGDERCAGHPETRVTLAVERRHARLRQREG